MFYLFIFLVGLSVGSFFNVIIFRFGTGKSVVKGRSNCLNCGSVIRWLDLIPVFSYFVLRGKCKSCGISISPLYPVVEITTGALLLLLFLNTPVISYMTMISAFVIAFLVLIIFIDIRYLIIPDKILFLLIGAVICSKLLADNADFYWNIRWVICRWLRPYG